ncbi:MAG: DUF3105 domain-containing protein [Anaerolineae bacterium]|nr:DUF3105 domain-containing protein [Anaerolineae bacterium]
MGKKSTRLPKSKRTGRANAQQKNNMYYVWFAVGGVILALVVIGLFYLGYNGQAIANSGIEGLEIFPELEQTHVDGNVDYNEVIPAGGPHNPVWQLCGIYDEPVRPENAIHSMEHGAVWLTYQPDLPEEDVEQLRSVVRQQRSAQGEAMIILSPEPDLESPLVATAWRVQLTLDDVNDERLEAFLDRYQRGPFYPEPGANCTFGGIGEPTL